MPYSIPSFTTTSTEEGYAHIDNQRSWQQDNRLTSLWKSDLPANDHDIAFLPEVFYSSSPRSE